MQETGLLNCFTDEICGVRLVREQSHEAFSKHSWLKNDSINWLNQGRLFFVNNLASIDCFDTDLHQEHRP